MGPKERICNFFTSSGKENRILFCLFWLAMYSVVFLSRFIFSDGKFPYFHFYNPGLLQKSAIIVPFDLGEVSQMLTTLLLISSFLERALEVYVLTFRKKIDEELDLQAIKLNRSLEAIKGTIANLTNPSTGAITDQTKFDDEIKNALEYIGSKKIGTFTVDIKKYIEELVINNTEKISKHRDTTRRYTMWSALLLGILISLIGIRGLGQFFNLDSGNTWQDNCFKIIDIILTGAVIAGGSDVIHKILQVITTFMEAISTSNKAVAAANAGGTKP